MTVQPYDLNFQFVSSGHISRTDLDQHELHRSRLVWLIPPGWHTSLALERHWKNAIGEDGVIDCEERESLEG
jgi:hypothetical protein